MKFKIDKNPHGGRKNLYKFEELTFHHGITVLVGCNGSGKTTLTHLVINQLRKAGIKPQVFDNYACGATQLAPERLFHGDTAAAANAMCSSEGQKIMLWLEQCALQIGKHKRENPKNDHWIIFDAIDSGFSIDNIVEFKKLLILISEHEPNVHIIVTANSYELAFSLPCMDVQTGQYLSFHSYKEYRKFILKMGKVKDSSFNN